MAEDDKRRVLELDTAVYSRELRSGAWTSAPVAELHHLSYGGQTAVTDDVREFLSTYLKDARATTVAQYCLPADLSLRTVRVSLSRDDLPQGIDKTLDVDVPIASASRPAYKKAWAVPA